jgi:hypothetical protein
MANKILPVRGPVVVTTANESLRRYGEQLLAWPNPFSFGLRISAEIKGEKVELADVFGKVYFSGYDIENQDFRRLPEGLFFLKTQGGTCIRLLHTCMHF